MKSPFALRLRFGQKITASQTRLYRRTVVKKIARLNIAVLAVAATMTFAQSSSSPLSTDKTPPSYDLKPQAIVDLEDMKKKFVQLAEAIPSDKYTWRPGSDVRSISELFLHVSGTTYQLVPMMSAAPDPGIDTKNLEKSTTDKDQVVAQLNKSFGYILAALANTSNDDLKKPVKKFGPEASAGDVLYLIAMDAHEHLGQAIAYARVNGIVPPWTAEARKKAGAHTKP
jgi:uncharacterized damage-inducible protein DinB